VKAFHKSTLLLAIATMSLVGCGGGGGAASSVAANITGKFIDAAVSGMSYKCGTSTTVSGTTNALGEYTCPAGQAVAFYVGDILIGRIASPTAIVTPMDLVGAGTSPTNATVQNIVRFLMSVSSTAPSTGTLTITPALIAAATGKTLDFATASAATIDAQIALIKPGATVYTNAQAATHLSSSMNALFAGTYSGTYTGSFAGTWSVTIDANGVVTGTCTDPTPATFPVTGNMTPTLGTGGTYAFTGTCGQPWTGGLNLNTNVFSGTWGVAPSSGTFTGMQRTAASAVPATPSAAVIVPVTPGPIIQGFSNGTFGTLAYTGGMAGLNLAAVSAFVGGDPMANFYQWANAPLVTAVLPPANLDLPRVNSVNVYVTTDKVTNAVLAANVIAFGAPLAGGAANNGAGLGSWNLIGGTGVAVNLAAKTVTFTNATLSGVAPTTTTITLNGTYNLP
jgi:hypothetical protein